MWAQNFASEHISEGRLERTQHFWQCMLRGSCIRRVHHHLNLEELGGNAAVFSHAVSSPDALFPRLKATDILGENIDEASLIQTEMQRRLSCPDGAGFCAGPLP